MMKMVQRICIIIAIAIINANDALDTTDPCFSYTHLNDSTRLTSYTLKNGETENGDSYLTAGWYRNTHITEGQLMTSCPNMSTCGTAFPVWINDTLPSKGKTKSVTTCKHTFRGCCASSSTIQVKNCDSFYVYELQPMSAMTGRYCFLGPRKCTSSESSPTGHAPCSANHLTFNVRPRVSPALIRDHPPNQNLAFRCSGVSSTYQHLHFDIVWEVEGTEVIRKHNMTFASHLTEGSLKEAEWKVTGHKIGMHVRCGIRARNVLASTAFVFSEAFFAGFEIREKQMTVNGGDSASVQIRTTVPIACPIGGSTCQIYIEMFDLSEQQSSTRQCNNNITSLKRHSHCGIQFNGSRWSYYQSMIVTTLPDQQYRSQYTAILKLRTLKNDYDPLWDDFVLPDVKVIVTDRSARSRKGKVCKFLTDPHIKSFDSSSYWGVPFRSIGEYILYKNKDKPYSVQTITSNRFDYGNCAVGVQAGADIFIIYGCEYRGKWVFKRYCNGDTKRMDIYEKYNGRRYEVHLPSGTYITVAVTGDHLDVEVHISPSEWNNTEGLCGNVNGIIHDDIVDRSGKTVSTNDFAKAWSVSAAESLFIEQSRTIKLDRPYYFCSCQNHVVSKFHETASCSWRDGLPLCPSLNWNEQQECSYRSKRDANGHTDEIVIDAPLDLINYKPPPTDILEWKNGWNHTSATEYCTRVITGTSAFSACKRHTSVDESENIAICVSDIQITGHTKFSAGAAESFASSCSNEIRLNTSLWTSQSHGQRSPADEVMDVQCPNDCKQDDVVRGTCVQGQCQCLRRYAGPDCSIDIEASPILLPPTTSNLCDLSMEVCGRVLLYGSNFNHMSTIKCRIQTMQHSSEQEQAMVEHNLTTDGIQKSFGEVMCPLGNIRKRRSPGSSISSYTKLLLSVSNNAHNFSNPVPVVIFDSACMSCTLPGGRIVCKQRNDICVTADQCYPLESKMCHQKTHGRKDNDDKDQQDSKLWIIGSVLGGVALLFIVIIVLYKTFVKKKMAVGEQYIEEPYPDLNRYNNPPASTHFQK